MIRRSSRTPELALIHQEFFNEMVVNQKGVSLSQSLHFSLAGFCDSAATIKLRSFRKPDISFSLLLFGRNSTIAG
jgi:hypothetical protein